jgi:hypothetical protein
LLERRWRHELRRQANKKVFLERQKYLSAEETSSRERALERFSASQTVAFFLPGIFSSISILSASMPVIDLAPFLYTFA